MVKKVNKKKEKEIVYIDELINEIREYKGCSDISKIQIKSVLNALMEEITAQLGKGNDVQIKGYLTFSTRKQEAKEMIMAFGAKKGKKIKVPAKNIPTCSFGSVLKTEINKNE